MKRLRYISRMAPGIGSKDIQEIVRSSQQNNPARDITGVLLASGGMFYQMIEGPSDEVDALFGYIQMDARHKDVLILATEEGDFERLCPDWAMEKVDLSQSAMSKEAPTAMLLRVIMTQRRLADEALETLEAYTWEAMLAAQLESANH